MSLKYCRICTKPALSPLWVDYEGQQWHRCSACGSDSSEVTYHADHYGTEYLDAQAINTGSRENALDQVRSNCDWYDHHARPCIGRSFLDVGCLEGAAMEMMQSFGWSVHGFDVHPSRHRPGCTTIHPYFAASLFPQLYDAILCREVIEHVDGWRQLLIEMTACLNRNGLLQVQTPKPISHNHGIPYQKAHLQLFSPKILAEQIQLIGFDIVDRREWDLGHVILARRVRGVSC